ncbi:unnamed protein product [Sphenostylis stenocarpa]|uniref:MYB-CC type transcription factor LHEQLE-containing domain-containing protein n=1 Tax=Sphenostylis stenocarpa TaxID=92480 RepID=A0AA86VZQ6_9FABA|nr:unnamed protein product [Sphenostylis stenocarpa]
MPIYCAAVDKKIYPLKIADSFMDWESSDFAKPTQNRRCLEANFKSELKRETQVQVAGGSFFMSLELISLLIQRNLQLRIEEQGRYLQMMFEKQCKSGTETLKASSSTIETPSGVSSNATRDFPAKNVLEASQMDHCRSGPDQANGSATVEEGSLEKGGNPDSPKTQHAIANCDGAEAPKRQRTE